MTDLAAIDRRLARIEALLSRLIPMADEDKEAVDEAIQASLQKVKERDNAVDHGDKGNHTG
jgi:hypothetical protein